MSLLSYTVSVCLYGTTVCIDRLFAEPDKIGVHGKDEQPGTAGLAGFPELPAMATGLPVSGTQISLATLYADEVAGGSLVGPGIEVVEGVWQLIAGV